MVAFIDECLYFYEYLKSVFLVIHINTLHFLFVSGDSKIKDFATRGLYNTLNSDSSFEDFEDSLSYFENTIAKLFKTES